MGELYDFINANLKEGADLTKLDALMKKHSTDSIETKEQAIDFMLKNPKFTAGLDYKVQGSVASGIENFKSGEMQRLIDSEREKIKLELNPPKTEAEKRLAEIEKKLADKEAAEARYNREKALRGKAKELGFDEGLAESFAVHGENAESVLAMFAEKFKAGIDSRLEQALKERIPGSSPARSNVDPAKVMARAELEKLAPAERVKFATGGGEITD